MKGWFEKYVFTELWKFSKCWHISLYNIKEGRNILLLCLLHSHNTADTRCVCRISVDTQWFSSSQKLRAYSLTWVWRYTPGYIRFTQLVAPANKSAPTSCDRRSCRHLCIWLMGSQPGFSQSALQVCLFARAACGTKINILLIIIGLL